MERFTVGVKTPLQRLIVEQAVALIHAESARRGVPICVRSVTNFLDRYGELLALSTSDVGRPRRITTKAGRGILAIDGLQPDVGHEVL